MIRYTRNSAYAEQNRETEDTLGNRTHTRRLPGNGWRARRNAGIQGPHKATTTVVAVAPKPVLTTAHVAKAATTHAVTDVHMAGQVSALPWENNPQFGPDDLLAMATSGQLSHEALLQAPVHLLGVLGRSVGGRLTTYAATLGALTRLTRTDLISSVVGMGPAKADLIEARLQKLGLALNDNE